MNKAGERTIFVHWIGLIVELALKEFIGFVSAQEIFGFGKSEGEKSG